MRSEKLGTKIISFLLMFLLILSSTSPMLVKASGDEEALNYFEFNQADNSSLKISGKKVVFIASGNETSSAIKIYGKIPASYTVSMCTVDDFLNFEGTNLNVLFEQSGTVVSKTHTVNSNVEIDEEYIYLPKDNQRYLISLSSKGIFSGNLIYLSSCCEENHEYELTDTFGPYCDDNRWFKIYHCANCNDIKCEQLASSKSKHSSIKITKLNNSVSKLHCKDCGRIFGFVITVNENTSFTKQELVDNYSRKIDLAGYDFRPDFADNVGKDIKIILKYKKTNDHQLAVMKINQDEYSGPQSFNSSSLKKTAKYVDPDKILPVSLYCGLDDEQMELLNTPFCYPSTYSYNNLITNNIQSDIDGIEIGVRQYAFSNIDNWECDSIADYCSVRKLPDNKYYFCVYDNNVSKAELDTIIDVDLVHIHTNNIVDHKDPNCFEDGYTDATCSMCDWEDREIIPQLDHVFNYIGNSDPTCLDPSYEIWECELCQTRELRDEVAPALGHDIVSSYIPPTCSSDGIFSYQICSRCKQVYGDSFTVPKLDHKYVKTSETKPTCTEGGEVIYTCETCGETYSSHSDPLGHSYKKVRIVKANYDRDGYDEYKCRNCKDAYTVITETKWEMPTFSQISVSLTQKTQNALKYEWNSQQNVDYYYAYVSINDGTYKKIATVNDCSYTLNNPKSYTKYSLYVVAIKKSHGKIFHSNRSNASECQTDLRTPVFKNISIANRKLKLKYSSVGRATGYIIQISTNKDFTTYQQYTTKEQNKKIRLSSKKTYFVRIRAYKNINGSKIYSNWSSIKSTKQ